jgi:hypothetical protein
MHAAANTGNAEHAKDCGHHDHYFFSRVKKTSQTTYIIIAVQIGRFTQQFLGYCRVRQIGHYPRLSADIVNRGARIILPAN